jgi:hypothetical protein
MVRLHPSNIFQFSVNPLMIASTIYLRGGDISMIPLYFRISYSFRLSVSSEKIQSAFGFEFTDLLIVYVAACNGLSCGEEGGFGEEDGIQKRQLFDACEAYAWSNRIRFKLLKPSSKHVVGY